MKYERLSKADFGSDDPDFNLRAAIATFNWYMKEDRPSADMMLGMAISDTLPDTIAKHYDELQAAVDRMYERRMALLRDSVSNGVVSKSMTDGAANAAGEVIKAFDQYTTYERSANAGRQTRDRSGRFSPMGRTTMQYSNKMKRNKDIDTPNIKAVPKDARGQYQMAYEEVARSLSGMGVSAENPVWGRISRVDRTGRRDIVTRSGSSTGAFVSPADFEGRSPNKGVIESVEWYDRPPTLSMAGSHYDPLVGSFTDGIVEAGTVNPYESGATRGMRQVGNAANVINNSGLADSASPKVQAALAAGKWVGDYGPEAEKVLGPTIRRTGYRYRGVERKPDDQMISAMGASTRNSASPEEARRDLMVPKRTMVETGFGLEERQIPSPFLQYWQRKLPDPGLLDLHTNSGAIAPSEGMIINRKGEVVTQAVGYGDDHYLPFNLAKLSRAKGGEYVRTRTVGGPTTEDIYAGVMSGARSATVVSHSGVYTIEFDPSFRGGRRYSDKAAQMQKRYGLLTDSLASEKVQLAQIPSARKKELRARAESEIPGRTSGILKERELRYRELLSMERKSPEPTQDMKDEWTQDYLLDLTDKMSGASSAGRKGDSYNDQYDMTPERLRAQMELKRGSRFESDEEFIAELGKEKQYGKYMEFKRNQYRDSMKPLRLNGDGYHKALRALQEQFPYFIKDVRYVPATDADALKRRDAGYVKPKHLRSDHIKTGYWDQSIEGYDGDPSGTGKRPASEENYSNYSAHVRRDRIPSRKDEPEGGGQSFSGGGSGGDAAPAASEGGMVDGQAAPSGDFSRKALAYSGIQIERGSNGGLLRYSGFTHGTDMPNQQSITEWEKINRLQNVRSKLREIDNIVYYNNNTRTKAWLWSDAGDNSVVQNLIVLMDPKSDSQWIDWLQENPAHVEEAWRELQTLKQHEGSRNIYGGVYRALEAKDNAVSNALREEDEYKHPSSVRGVVLGLKNGEDNQYDFSTANRSGIYYLPGLSDVEYNSAWNSDQDIQAFMSNSEQRFGYRMSMAQKEDVFRGLSKDFGKAMDTALGHVDRWNAEIIQFRGARNVPNKNIVTYGNKDYSIYDKDALENDIARDALAVAKMKQLRRAKLGSAPAPSDSGYRKKNEEEPPQRTMELSEDFDVAKPNRTPVNVVQTKKEKKEEKTESQPFKDKDGKPKQIDEAKLDSAKEAVNSMVGLKGPKKEFDSLIQEAEVAAMREAAGLPNAAKTRHLVLVGDPGTGKTTYVESIAQAYNALGIIPSDEVTYASRTDLVGQYVGETAQKTRKVMDKGRGGVIFIDEAYALNDDSYGKEAIDELVYLADERRNDTIIIMAGYPKDMSELMEINPGLRSRFPRTISFPNYNPRELTTIGQGKVEEGKYEMDAGAKKELSRIARKITQSPNYSNGRDIRNFIEDISRSHTERIASIPHDEVGRDTLVTVTAQDVRAAEKRYFNTRTGNVQKSHRKHLVRI